MATQDSLTKKRRQLAVRWQRHYDTVAQLLDRLVAEQSKVIDLRQQIMLIDFELDKLIDRKIAHVWEEPGSENQVQQPLASGLPDSDGDSHSRLSRRGSDDNQW